MRHNAVAPACLWHGGLVGLVGHGWMGIQKEALVYAGHHAPRPHPHTHVYLALALFIHIIRGPVPFPGMTRSVQFANVFCLSVHTIVLVLLITYQLLGD